MRIMTFGISYEAEELLKKYPPILELVNTVHGGGIDYDWYAEETKNNIILYNSYHTMDENGYYDRIVGFKVIIPKEDIFSLKIQCTSDRYGWNKYMLGDYLRDTIYFGLLNGIEKFRDVLPINSGIRKETIYRIFPINVTE